ERLTWENAIGIAQPLGRRTAGVSRSFSPSGLRFAPAGGREGGSRRGQRRRRRHGRLQVRAVQQVRQVPPAHAEVPGEGGSRGRGRDGSPRGYRRDPSGPAHARQASQALGGPGGRRGVCYTGSTREASTSAGG